MNDLDINLSVNGSSVSARVEARTLLVDFIRDHLTLTGTHVGCDTSQCGACTVLLDGRAVKSCNVLVAQADGCAVTTIEGMAAPDGTLHPLQCAFKKHHALQCGFCTPGMIMSAAELLRTHQQATRRDIQEALDGNLCRCTGYRGIVDAVAEVISAARDDVAPTAGA
jgi:aerobic carbon-monoxide dehydrogenase small subunit